MAEVNFYFEYRNSQRVQLPVNPSKLTIQAPGENSTINIIDLGEVNVLKNPGLKTVSFESFIPVVNSGSYVQKDARVLSPDFYIDYFEAIQKQKEPINFVVTGLDITMQVSVEDFEYWWDGTDPDMHFKLSLKQYRKNAIKITTIGSSITSPVNTTVQSNSRQNTAKKVVVGSKVLVNGRLHRDSYGNGPGVTEKNATRRVNFVKNGRACPYHVTTLEGGWRGWVTANSVEVID